MNKTNPTIHLCIRRNDTLHMLCDIVIVDKYSNILEVTHTGITLEQAQCIVESNQDCMH